MLKQTAGELLQREDLESCAIPEPLNKFLNRGVSVAGIAAGEGLTATTESAGKWRRNDLKRLNPGREMVWARPQDVVRWRAADGAPLRLTSGENDKLFLASRRERLSAKRVARKWRR